MASTLQALQALQEIEMKLAALRDRVASKERGVHGAQRRMEQIQAQIDTKHGEIMRQQALVAQLELDIKTHDAEVSKLREALNRSRTNKEYAAILTQINTDKADTGKIEDRVLEMMTEVEALREQEAELKARYHQEEQRLQNANAELDAFRQASAEELNALQRSREEAADAVPREALTLFDRAADRLGGEVLAAVLQPHPKRDEFICDGCNMGVTLEQYVALQSRDQMQVCHSCGRILCLGETSLR